jgi:hypothetical protein
MILFQQPCSGFSASDLAALEQLWPNGEHKSDSHGDHLVVRRPGERSSWLSIVRHRDGTYLSLNSSGDIYAQGNSLADLALDGVEGPSCPPERRGGRSEIRRWEHS